MIKDTKTLTIRNHVIFGLVMHRKNLAIKCLERILGKTIRDIIYIEPEKTEEVSAEVHGVRLDVYCEDEEAVYNVDLQAYRRDNLPKRSRYYQDMMDMILLKKGESYNALKKNIVIFICTFDPFGNGEYIYTFENRCIQVKGLSLSDDTSKIFLNTKGEKGEISLPLKMFLEYIEKGEATDEFTRELDEAVAEVRSDDKWREPIMTWEMLKEDIAYAAREEGRTEGVSQEKKETVRRMLQAGKNVDDICIATGLTEKELHPLL